jgi:hypothetical protein
VLSQAGVLKWSADALASSSAWLVHSGDWQLVYSRAGVLDFEGRAAVHLQEGAKYVVRCSAIAPWNLILEVKRFETDRLDRYALFSAAQARRWAVGI